MSDLVRAWMVQESQAGSNIHFQGGERAFYITSCAHIFCSDERHNREHLAQSYNLHQDREGTCTACKGKAAIHRLEEGLPSAVKSYFQAPKFLLSSINSAVGALNVWARRTV